MTEDSRATMEKPVDFVALGGIWLDEICAPGKETLFDVPGGSVAFATFGYHLFAVAPKQIGLIVKAGYDFPPVLEETFAKWKYVDLHILRQGNQPSSRGRIVYGHDASERTYQRLTQPLPSTVQDLTTTNMITSSVVHFFDVPAAVSAQIDEIETLREQVKVDDTAYYVWEPQAKSCSPESLEAHKAVAEMVAIFSPNHAELASFFKQQSGGPVEFDRAAVEQQAAAFVPDLFYQSFCIIVRCAEHGCFVLTASEDKVEKTWLPPFHLPGSDKVVDTTGAGNTFLGAAGHGYLVGDHITAAVYGTIAASFAVEKVGLPDPEQCDAQARLDEYIERLDSELKGRVVKEVRSRPEVGGLTSALRKPPPPVSA